MAIRSWFERFSKINSISVPASTTFPVAAFWRSICNSRQPTILVKDGLQVLAATEEAYKLLDAGTPAELASVLKTGLDHETFSNIQSAIANPATTVSELPVQIQTVGSRIDAIVTVSALPEYPEQNAAILFLKDNRNHTLPVWARTSCDLLSRIPLPAWLINAKDEVVFSNGAFSSFPLKLIQAETLAQDGRAEGKLAEDMARLLSDVKAAPAAVRNNAGHVEAEYNLGPYGNWRVLHFPLKSAAGESVVGALAMPLDAVPAVRSDEYSDSSEFVALMGQDALAYVLQVKEAERTALARELHDSLGQELTVLKLEMRRLNKMVVGTDAGTALVLGHFQSVRQLLEDLSKTARRIAYGMRQDLTAGQGLSHTVQDLVTGLRERMGLQIQFELMPDWVEPEQGMAHHLQRSLQEMLNNVSKHAKASRCLVRMGMTGTTYWLEVRDDGVGMQPDRRTRSIGLRSLTERAAIYGGQVTIRTRPEVEGTLVRVEMTERRMVTQTRQARVA